MFRRPRFHGNGDDSHTPVRRSDSDRWGQVACRINCPRSNQPFCVALAKAHCYTWPLLSYSIDATIAARPLLPYTYDDYRTLSEDMSRRNELLHGDLYRVPAPTTRHQRISNNLNSLLRQQVKHCRLGEILYAPVDVILGHGDAREVAQPDLVFVAASRRDIVKLAWHRRTTRSRGRDPVVRHGRTRPGVQAQDVRAPWRARILDSRSRRANNRRV